MVFSFFDKKEDEASPETERGGYECAPYSLLEKQSNYEVRKYPSQKWATVVHEKTLNQTNNDMPMSENWKQNPQNKSFMKLFAYISGENESRSKISMTVPVSTKVTTEENGGGGLVMKEEMGFYVPSNLQMNTPEPKAEVNVVVRPEMVAYVKEFGGYAKDKDWQEQKDQLKKDLEDRNDFQDIDFDMYYR